MQTLAPFGMRPVYHPTGLDRARAYTIASAYGTAIFKGDPVTLNTNGTVTIGAATADILGVFDGVEFIDATGKPTESNFWPAGQTVQSGTAPTAYIWDNPEIVFEIQANGSVAQAAVGDQADFIVGAGNTLTGLSTTVMSSTLEGVGVQGQLRIVGFNLAPDNSPGDTYTVVQVEIAQHVFRANKVAI